MLIIRRTLILGLLVLTFPVHEARAIGATQAMSKVFTGHITSKIGHGLLIGGASLFFMCTQPGCGGGEMEAGESASSVVEMVAPDDDAVEVEKPYAANDYIGRYVVFVSDGEGSIDSGLVVDKGKNAGELVVIEEPQQHVRVRKRDEFGRQVNGFELIPIGGLTHVPMKTIIGVMDTHHDEIGTVVEFNSADARSYLSLFFAETLPRRPGKQQDDGEDIDLPPHPDDIFAAPMLVRGSVNAVYVDPIHTDYPNIAIVSVVVRSGLIGDEWKELDPSSTYVSYDSVSAVE